LALSSLLGTDQQIMSKILVIEPHQMLRHAFAAALSPEHLVTVSERIPEPGSFEEAELIIIDAAALRERNSLAGQELNSIARWQLPTIWIDTAAGSQALTIKKIVLLSWPLEKAVLQKTVTECLGKVKAASAPSMLKKESAPPVPAKVKPQQATKSPSAPDAGKQLIELVDVVE
jgi:hypothetical protein